jgi:hypothetical protein
MQNGFAMHHTLQNDSSTKNKMKNQSLCKQTQMHIPILNFMTSLKGLKLSKIVDFELVKHCSSQITTPEVPWVL